MFPCGSTISEAKIEPTLEVNSGNSRFETLQYVFQLLFKTKSLNMRHVYQLCPGTCKVRNEIKTKRNETKPNETKSNETKRKRKQTKRNEKTLNFIFLVFQIIKTREDGGHLGFLMKKKRL